MFLWKGCDEFKVVEETTAIFCWHVREHNYSCLLMYTYLICSDKKLSLKQLVNLCHNSEVWNSNNCMGACVKHWTLTSDSSKKNMHKRTPFFFCINIHCESKCKVHCKRILGHTQVPQINIVELWSIEAFTPLMANEKHGCGKLLVILPVMEYYF